VKTRLRDRDDTLYTRYYNSDFGLCVCVCVCGSVGVCKVDLAALRGDKKEDKETRNSGEQTKAQGGRQSSEHGTFMPLQKCSPRFKQGQKAYVLASERRSPKKKHMHAFGRTTLRVGNVALGPPPPSITLLLLAVPWRTCQLSHAQSLPYDNTTTQT